MGIEEFLAWEAQQSKRFEFVDGVAAAVDDATQQHSLLKSDIISALRAMVRGTNWRVIANIRLVVPVVAQVWHPAVIVDAGPFHPDALQPEQPVLVIDVGRTRVVSADLPFAYLSVKADDEIAAVQHLLRCLQRTHQKGR